MAQDTLRPVNEEVVKDKYYTLAAVVEDAIGDIDNDMSKFMKFLKYAQRGYRNLNYSGHGEIKTVRLPMNDTKTLIMPEDYVSYQKLALIINGFVKTIGVAYDAKATPGQDECGNMLRECGINDIPNGIDFGSYNYGGYYFNNYGGRTLYSYGGGLPYKGYYKEYRMPRPSRISFTSEVNTYDVLVEYITDGLNPTGQTLIDPLDYEYIRTFIHQERVKDNDRSSDVLLRRKKQEHHSAKKTMVVRKDKFGPQDLLNLTRQNRRLTVKA